MDDLTKRVAARFASGKESVRLKALQSELKRMAERLDEIVDEAVLDPAVAKKLAKEFKSKSTWADLPRAPDMAQRMSTGLRTLASALDYGVVLAETVGE